LHFLVFTFSILYQLSFLRWEIAEFWKSWI